MTVDETGMTVDESGSGSGDESESEDDFRQTGLCYNAEEMCLGSDPHFAIRLPGGQLLCYTFQGAHNTTFNLVSNRQLEMNALFVPDQTNWDNTWLGAIGMTVHDGKKRATLQFTAADQRVQVGETTPIAAHSIKKISSHKGRLTVVRFPPGHIPRYPRVQVELKDTDVNFTVAFTKRNHLDLHWHSAGEPFEDSKGVVGQFFRQGVKVDVDSQLLHLPGRPAVPVERKPLWKFMKHSFQRDTKCWTSLYSSSQGAGIVEGSYEDYIVDGLLAVEL